MKNNVPIEKETLLHTKSPKFNNVNGDAPSQFKRFGSDCHANLAPHVHQPARNAAPNGNIYGGMGSKTSNGGVTTPHAKDIK
ncbi:hypothetical protein [Lysinibacillus odysseyi]|uniref:Uncharacterized protein n=1 Tax=Lysinibacillus odysseyi 34hs-1 = NBRC 100172 TaxID=1220589 RepID=A0A0A3IC14_9BACI|nr:hypothetical protein [Lysinibacillus odysseyi]KGR82259.1 hypothetical protein CD32_23590 [Lysinibacillus odysseyi 34hs-1 = NBRC 100172]